MGSSVSGNQGLVQVEICVGTYPQTLHWSPKAHRHYVAGTPGTPYMIRVTNRTSQDIEVLPSVDGRSTLRDEVASLTARGMVIRAHDVYVFAGFQTDDRQHQNRFVFTDPGQAIATQAGESANIGVIGIAAYRGSGPKPSPFVVTNVTSNVPFYGAFSGSATMDMNFSRSIHENVASVAMAAPSLGTGMGETVSKPTVSTEFSRTGGPDIVSIGYDTMERLREMGIVISPNLPQPFPGGGYDRYNKV